MSTVSILSERGQVLTTVETDAHDPHRMVERIVQDVDPLIEHVKRQVDARNGGKKHLDGLTLVGYIPDVFVSRMMREGSLNDERAVRRFFNDPANKPFKVYWGTV
jgi:hypothetical protein